MHLGVDFTLSSLYIENIKSYKKMKDHINTKTAVILTLKPAEFDQLNIVYVLNIILLLILHQAL